MKVVFLDFDGVLNTTRSDCMYGFLPTLEELLVDRLNRVMTATGAHVVISSSWRIHALHRVAPFGSNREATTICSNWLTNAGFMYRDRVIDMTPRIASYPSRRGLEIGQWLLTTSHAVESVLILDDDADMAYMRPWWMAVDPVDGLTDENVTQATNFLAQNTINRQAVENLRDDWFKSLG